MDSMWPSSAQLAKTCGAIAVTTVGSSDCEHHEEEIMSKADKIRKLLCRKSGASITQLINATGKKDEELIVITPEEHIVIKDNKFLHYTYPKRGNHLQQPVIFL